ncbi:MAG: hypothetical protein FJX67_18145 [Alphaproteobacteria bacterium]|nr:hypothetical protein [Alphaproteobacteria bacterium]
MANAPASVRIERRLPVPPARAFDAWTRPAEIRRWWGRRGYTAEIIECDVREGGAWRLAMRSPEGNLNVVRGRFTRVEPPHHLVYTWAWDSAPDQVTEVAVEFRAEGDGTRMTLVHTGFKDGGSAAEHDKGWSSHVDALADYAEEIARPATLTIYGGAASTFVRTARLVCEEKAIAYTLEPVDFRSAAYRALHPFGRMPAMRHGAYTLYETRAIASYLDDLVPAPRLTPEDSRQRAEMEKWISISNNYVDLVTTRVLILERLVARVLFNRDADEAAIRAAVPTAETQFAVIEAELAKRPYLAGASLTLADLFLAPIVFYLPMFAEGRALLADRPAIARWYDGLARRPSFAATEPEFRPG